MARQVLPIVGAVVGAYFGNPQLGYAIGAIIGNAVDPQVIKTPGIKDLPTQTAGEGAYRQVVYGTCWINQTNIIDFGDVRRVTVRERQGKGGGPVVESERLYRTYAIGLGEPLAGIRVIRRNGKIVYDVRPGSTILDESAEFANRFTFYTGAEDQLPDPDLEALSHNGVGNTPYYRGTAYMVFPDDDLTDQQGMIPTYEVEGFVEGTPAVISDWLLIVSDDEVYRAADSDWDNTSLSGTVGASATLDRLLASGDNLVTWQGAVSSSAYASTDGGENWSAATGFVGAGRDGSYSAGRFWVGASIDGLNKSGTLPAFTNQSPPNVNWAGGNVNFLYAFGGFLSQYVSTDNGATWPAVTVGASDYMDGGICAASLTQVAIAATNGTNSPHIAISSDGDTFTEHTLPNARSVTSVKKLLAFGSKWVLFLANGDIYAGSGAVWTRSSFVATSINDAATDGSVIYAVGDAGYVIRSTDTDTLNWEVVSTNLGSANIQCIASSSAIDPAEAGEPIPLSGIVEDICQRCGLADSQIDFSALDESMVLGVTLGGPYDGASTVALFFAPYSFDLAQPDKVLKAVPRGAAVVDTLTADDFIEGPDESILRGQDIEYPRALMLKYLDAEQNYAAPAATVQRTTPDSRVTGEATMELPISLPRSDTSVVSENAFQIADKILKVMWEDLNGEIEFSVPSGRFCDMAPADCYGLSLRGGLYRIRITEVVETPWQLKVKARRDRQSAYTSNLTPIGLPPPTPPPPSLPGNTTYAIMNAPPLRDEDDRLGIYIAATGVAGAAWQGVNVAYSEDGGTTYVDAGNYTTRSVMGELTAALPAAPSPYTDRVNSLAVELVQDDELETVTEVEFHNEGNPAAIVFPDYTVEVVQFQTATDTGTQTWDLSTLKRGRLGTVAGPHAIGAKFVYLDTLNFIPLPASLLGKALKIRVTTIGTSPELAPVVDFTWSPAVSQYPLAPILKEIGTRVDGGNQFVEGTFIPRARLGTELNPILSGNLYAWRLKTPRLGGGTLVGQYAPLTDGEFSFNATGLTRPFDITFVGYNRLTGEGEPLTISYDDGL